MVSWLARSQKNTAPERLHKRQVLYTCLIFQWLNQIRILSLQDPKFDECLMRLSFGGV